MPRRALYVTGGENPRAKGKGEEENERRFGFLGVLGVPDSINISRKAGNAGLAVFRKTKVALSQPLTVEKPKITKWFSREFDLRNAISQDEETCF